MNQGSLRKDIIVCLMFVLLCLYLFRDIIFGGHLLTGADFVSFYLGLKQFLFNEVHRHHSIPLWNPYVFGGIPFWAHFESTIFYPLDFLFWFISPEKAYGPTMWFHFVLAACFMYLLARSLRLGYAASFSAAVVYILNGHILPVLNGGLMYRVQAYTWIPLIIFFLRRAAISERPYLNASVAGLLWAIQVLSGSPQDAFYTFLAGCLFLLCHAKFRHGEMTWNRRLLLIACLFFSTGAGLAGIQLVPAFEFINRSVRTLFDNPALRTMGSYPLQGVITMVMPHFFGNYVQGNFWVSGMPWTVPTVNLYVGILPLMLFLYISYRHSEQKRLLLFSVVLAVVALLLAFGANTPLYKPVSSLPGFDRLRAPFKIISLWVFALGLLTGIAVDGFFQRSRSFLLRRTVAALVLVCGIMILGGLVFLDHPLVLKVFSPFVLKAAIPAKMTGAADIIASEYRRLMLLSALGLLLILLYTRRLLNRRLAAVLFCALLVGDLLFVNRGAVPHQDGLYKWVARTKAELDNSIGKDKEIYRVGSYKFGMGANIEMLLGYQTVDGYNAMFLRRYYEYINQYRFYKKPVPPGWIILFYEDHKNSVLMDLLNVKYVISYSARSYRLRNSYLPRAFIVPQGKILQKDKILDRLIEPGFDPRKTVLLEGDTPLTGPSEKRPATGHPPGEATITLYRPDKIVIRTHSREPGYLFLSEAFYPGWKAYVDGTPVRIFRGDYLFRVIELPRGSHVVRYIFDPFTIKAGEGITLLTILLLAFAALIHRRRSKSRPPQGH